GYGGSCFPKDVKAMMKFASDKKYRFRILDAVEAVNETQKLKLLTRLDKHFGKSLKGKTMAVWGLAFKPRTDDMREAPAVPIIEGLLARGAKVRAFDPEAKAVAKLIFKSKITYARNAYDALKGADALLVVTEWNEFREPNFAKMKRLLKQPVIFDGRNIFDPVQIRGLGFTYSSIGRP
ncbi:MAG: UDP binding domain-containing protein, partial [Acidobacteriota bacterium]